MIPMKFLFTPTDKDTQRRRVLARVYALLIKLAEEKENQDPRIEKEDAGEVSVPLQKNIPPEV